jgi:plastocyanin
MVITRALLPSVLLAAVTAAGCLSGSFTGEGSGNLGGGGGDDDAPPADNGNGGGDDTQPPASPPDAGPPADYALAVSPISAELVLGETRTFTVTITGANGFSGPVALAATGIPATWSAKFEPATVEVAAGTPGTATLTLSIPTDAEIATGMLDVAGSAAPGERHASKADIVVKPEIVIRIPQGSVDNPENSFGPNGQVRVRYVAPGTKITWVNDDAVNHRIHADGAGGIQHQQGEIPPGGSYTDTITGAGVIDYNCHIHGQMKGRLVVLDAAGQ